MSLENRISKIEEKLKPVSYPEIIIERWMVDRVNGLLCYIGKYEKGRYMEFDSPIPVNKNREEM